MFQTVGVFKQVLKVIIILISGSAKQQLCPIILVLRQHWLRPGIHKPFYFISEPLDIWTVCEYLVLTTYGMKSGIIGCVVAKNKGMKKNTAYSVWLEVMSCALTVWRQQHIEILCQQKLIPFQDIFKISSVKTQLSGTKLFTFWAKCFRRTRACHTVWNFLVHPVAKIAIFPQF